MTDVLPSPSEGVFYMWYMGTRQTPNNDVPAFGVIPATRGGVAVSYDGVHFVSCKGPKAYGSFLEATPGTDGCMFLMTVQPHSVDRFGGPAMALSTASTRAWPKFAATSHCQAGVNAGTAGCRAPVPDCGKLMRNAQHTNRQPCPDGQGKPCKGRGPSNKNFHMFYNSAGPVNGSTTKPVPPGELVLQLFGATGRNIFNFQKTGHVASLAPSPDPLAPDSASTGSARVLVLPKHSGYLLFYEGVNKTSRRYSILMARSLDGTNWAKDTSCTGVPGGPVLLPGQDDAWDYYVGTPFPLLQPDGRIFLYYVGLVKSSAGQEGGVQAQIGLAIGHVSNPYGCMHAIL